MSRHQTATLEVEGVRAVVTWKPMKSMRMRVVPPDGEIRVSVPIGTPRELVVKFVSINRDWALELQTRVRLHRPVVEPLVDGGRARLWGRWLELVVRDGPRASARLVDGRVHLTRPAGDEAAARRALDNLYRRELRPVAEALIADWQVKVQRECTGLKLRRMTSRWGTCNTISGVITLNLALAERHPDALEYIVVHELVHLVERGHGALFKGWMSMLLPDWPARRRALREEP